MTCASLGRSDNSALSPARRLAGRTFARGSLLNQLVILLPAAMLLSTSAPWLLTPLLMLGGIYLGIEGTEKIRVAGAIKTDFIVSAAAVEWIVTAGLDAIFGIALGLTTIPLVRYLLAPAARLFRSS